MRSGNDNLIVERMKASNQTFFLNESDFDIVDLQYGDNLVIENPDDLGSTPGSFAKRFALILFSGADVVSESGKVFVSKSQRPALLPVAISQYRIFIREQKKKQSLGIEKAKMQGKYKGRPKLKVDKDKLELAYRKFKAKEISLEEALILSEIPSRATFYRHVSEELERKQNNRA